MDRKLSSTALKMTQSLRSGQHATVYDIRRDPSLKKKDVIRDYTKPVFPFVGGSQYKGEWRDDLKEGFGIQINPDNTKYEGEWQAGKYHGRGTLWLKKGIKYLRQYVGDWVDGCRQGQGIYYFENGQIYRGSWNINKKHGPGRMEYPNGDLYNGEWHNDKPDGYGSFFHANGNVYEGLWVSGKKEGPGIYYYAATKKVYQGEWLDDQPQCGEYRDPDLTEELRFFKPLPKGIFLNQFNLPGLKLADSSRVLDLAVAETRIKGTTAHHHGISATGSGDTGDIAVIIDPTNLSRAKRVFDQVSGGGATISIFSVGNVIQQFGLNLTSEDVNDIVNQLELRDAEDISFSEAVEIASYLHIENSSSSAAGFD